MNIAAFLDRHQGGLGRSLGITYPSASAQRVVAQLSIGPEHLAPSGAMQGGIVTALADCANVYGAMLNVRSGCDTRTLESKTNFFAAGEGRSLRAEASPIQLGRTISVWRATVFRGEQAIADVTQTQLTVDAENTAEDASAPAPAEARRGSGRGIPAVHFSQSVVDERWRRILEGAAEVIAAKGFAKATIREIAAAADMPVPTMYQYFERKEDLLHGLYRLFMTDIIAALEPWRLGAVSSKQRLIGAVRTTVDVFDRHHRFIKLMFQETRALTPDARQQVYELDDQYVAIFRDLLQQATRSGDIQVRNVELAANFIYFLCAIWPLRFWSIGKHGAGTVADEIVDFVLGGLHATPDSDPNRRTP